MLMFSVPARAQDEDPWIYATLQPQADTVGTWNVVANSADGDLWTVKIYAGSGLVSDINWIHIELRNANGNINVDSKSGSIQGDGTWTASDTSTFTPDSGGPHPDSLLLKTSTDTSGYFLATINLRNFGTGNNLDNGAVTSLYVDAKGTCEWTGTGYITPEGSSLAMLLPGLLPLALVIRRRRRI